MSHSSLMYSQPLLAALLCSCQVITTSTQPDIVSIQPSEVTTLGSDNGQLLGSGFYASAFVPLSDDTAPSLDRGFIVRIGNTLLPPEAIGESTPEVINIDIPEGLAPGMYDVHLTTPMGLEATLLQGLTVLQERQVVMVIEDAPGGSGRPLDGQELSPSTAQAAHAVLRNSSDDTFVMDLVDVNWAVSGSANLSADAGATTTITPMVEDDIILTAEEPTYGQATASLTIRGCTLEGPVGDATCTDLVDNDCDGTVDLEDPGCTPGNTPPVADFVVAPGGGALMTTEFSFDASPSWDWEDGDATLEFWWDWQDDGTFALLGPAPSHSFASPGLKTVTLLVKDPNGYEGYFRGSVYVADAADIIEVTTSVDNVDAGDGDTSLREAIEEANMTPGPDLITFAGPMVIELGTDASAMAEELPVTNSGSPVIIAGQPGVIIDGAAISDEACMQFASSNNIAMWLEIRNCADTGLRVRTGEGNIIAHTTIRNTGKGIKIDSDNNEFGPGNRLFESDGSGVAIHGSMNRIFANRITTSAPGIAIVRNDAAYTTIVGNVLYNNTTHGISVRQNVDNADIWHNTCANNQSNGIDVAGNTTGISIQNNILYHNQASGISVNSDPSVLDHNAYAGNTAGPCDGCVTGGNAQLADPQFFAPALEDWRVHPDSVCVDAGAATTEDVNSIVTGLHNGAGPDIGAWEAP